MRLRFHIKIVGFCIQLLFHGKGIWYCDSCHPIFWVRQVFGNEIFRKNVETVESSHS